MRERGLHANCDCTYAVRFDSRTTIAGYDPDRYLEQYRAANGDLNAMRRAQYQENKDEINAQKREAYQARKALEEAGTKKITVEGSTKGKKRDKMNSEELIGIVVNGTTVSEVSEHILDRMEDRSVSLDAVRDALEHPLETKSVRYDDQGRPSFAVVGEKATVSINPDTGKLTTTYPTHTKTVQKLKHRKEREM